MRLALLVNADGERWVTEIVDTGHPPKTLSRAGKPYTLVMTMAVEHEDIAARWCRQVQVGLRNVRTPAFRGATQ